jgi:hypothetical protein
MRNSGKHYVGRFMTAGLRNMLRWDGVTNSRRKKSFAGQSITLIVRAALVEDEAKTKKVLLMPLRCRPLTKTRIEQD